MTLYAHHTAGAIDQLGALPRLWWDGTRWHDWQYTDPALRSTDPADSGWLPVVEAARPADTATDTWEPAYAVSGATVVQSWTARPWSVLELAERTAAAAYEAQRLIVKAIIVDLQAEKTRAQVVIDKPNNSVTGADTKDVARAAKRIADAAIDLARYVAP